MAKTWDGEIGHIHRHNHFCLHFLPTVWSASSLRSQIRNQRNIELNLLFKLNQNIKKIEQKNKNSKKEKKKKKKSLLPIKLSFPFSINPTVSYTSFFCFFFSKISDTHYIKLRNKPKRK